MKKAILKACYDILERTKITRIMNFCLASKIILETTKTLESEFDQTYLRITTVAKSQILFGKNVGSIHFQSGYWEEDNFDYCVLRSLWVHPLIKGRGIGTRLVKQCIVNAQMSGFKTIILTCSPTNSIAISVYEKSGFLHLSDLSKFEAFQNELSFAEEHDGVSYICFWLKLSS